ncbi:MAG: alpha-E domain-containing protein [Candidatus Sumerlaeaceae bacterium]
MLSRVADSLYWMSRYLERAEHNARVLDVNLQSMLDYSPESSSDRWQRLMQGLGADSADTPVPSDAYEVTRVLGFEVESEHSISACVQVARENARQVRQQISSEMWEQLNGLYLYIRSATIESIWGGQPHEFFTSIKQGAHLFQGITDSTLSHGEGWHFIQLGKYLERASATARLLDAAFGSAFMSSDSPVDAGEYLESVVLLKSCTAFEAYCKVYTAEIRRERIAEFLLLNPEFPRSVAFCSSCIKSSLDAISETTDTAKNCRVNRLAGRLCAFLDFTNIDEVFSGNLHHYLRDVQKQAAEIHNAVHQLYIEYAIEVALAS